MDRKSRSRDNRYHRPAATPRIDLNLLDVLHVVVEERNVSRAAARLGVTQPAISNALARLRHQVGDPLLVKTGGGVEPTARALALVTPVREALDAMTAAVEGARAFDPATYEGDFSLAGVDYATYVFAPVFAQRLRELAPRSRIRVARVSGAQAARQAADQYHLVLANTLLNEAAHHSAPLLEDGWSLIVREGHPLARRAKPTPEEAVAYRFVVSRSPGDELRTAADDIFSSLGHRRRIAVTVPSCAFVGGVVEATDHVSLIATRIARELAAEHRIRVLKSPIRMVPMEVRMQWHRRHEAGPLHRWLRARALEVAASL